MKNKQARKHADPNVWELQYSQRACKRACWRQQARSGCIVGIPILGPRQRTMPSSHGALLFIFQTKECSCDCACTYFQMKTDVGVLCTIELGNRRPSHFNFDQPLRQQYAIAWSLRFEINLTDGGMSGLDRLTRQCRPSMLRRCLFQPISARDAATLKDASRHQHGC